MPRSSVAIMARHRRHDQHARLRHPRRVLDRPFEMQQPAERPLPDGLDRDRNPLAADQGRGNSPLGLAVAPRRALEHLGGGRDRFSEMRVGEGIDRVLEVELGQVRECARRIERGLAHLVEPIDRRREIRQCRRPRSKARRQKPRSPPNPRLCFWCTAAECRFFVMRSMDCEGPRCNVRLSFADLDKRAGAPCGSSAAW